MQQTNLWIEQFERLSQRAAEAGGPQMTADLILGVTWVSLLSAAAIVAVVLLLDLLMRGIIRRKVRRDGELEPSGQPAEPRHVQASRRWLDLSLQAALPPMALLIWIYGLYAAASVLFLRLRVDEHPSLLVRGLDAIRDWGGFIVLFWLLFRMIRVVDARLKDVASKTASRWDDILAPLVAKSLRVILPLVAVILAIPMLDLSPESYLVVRNLVSILLILGVAILLFQLVAAVEEAVLSQFRIDVRDNLQARKVYTQVTVLKKVAFVVIGIFTVASTLMVFESVRQLGTSILASAGIAGIIIGFAAQKSIATLLAGFQIAITQPIRLDDVVIVENEWGRIEEITLTYVVVRIWDLRRLVVPVSYFIEKPFQNWTRVSADILGTVFFHVDYRAPIQALREELDRILEGSPLWDRKVKVLQVTDAKEQTLEVRALASAADAGAAWDLRCEVREKLIAFLQRNHPESLPRLRLEREGRD